MKLILVSACLFLSNCGNSDRCVPLLDSAMDAVTQRSCTQDSDCVFITTACGLPGQCGATVNVNAATHLESISKEWTSECPNDAKVCPHCPVPPTAVACVSGLCSCAGGSC